VASEGEIKERFSRLEAWLDERSRRLWAAAESVAHGRGGISLVSRASGVSRRAIAVGLAELQKKPDRAQRAGLPIRRKGGGRKKAALKDADLLLDRERLLEPVTRGDPQSPLRWTCKSVRNLAEELQARGHKVSHMLVAEMLHQQKYSLQANRKTKAEAPIKRARQEGSSHPDRNAQFEHINARATEFLKSGQPGKGQ
jgi:transposase